MHEDFSHYRDGDAADWGQNLVIKMGLDRRKWLVPNFDGTQPAGRKMRLPNEFSFECRYSAYLPDVTHGILGWWKGPIASKISFLSDQGATATSSNGRSVAGTTRRGSIHSARHRYAEKYYHTIKLPGGAASEVGILQPTGVLRIVRESGSLKVLLDGQAAAAGTITQGARMIGFEINAVKSRTAPYPSRTSRSLASPRCRSRRSRLGIGRTVQLLHARPDRFGELPGE